VLPNLYQFINISPSYFGIEGDLLQFFVQEVIASLPVDALGGEGKEKF
jgi:hypothetical protein